MILRGLFYFLILLLVSTSLRYFFDFPFGTVDFFKNHGVFFLIFITLFPRLTLLFSSVVSGGLVWWLGWLFFPRILVATLATFSYVQTNPILVTVAWLVAIGGETAEKSGVRIYRSGSVRRSMPRTPPPKDVIDVDFERR